MENTKAKTVVITVLVMLLILSLGVIIWQNFIQKGNINNVSDQENVTAKNEDNDQIKQKESNIEKGNQTLNKDETNNNNENEIKKEQDKFAILELAQGYAVLYNGNVYVNINLNMDVYGEKDINKLLQSKDKFKTYSFGNIEIDLSSIENKWLKLNESNVKEIVENRGNGFPTTDDCLVVLLHEDGTVSYCTLNNVIQNNPKTINLNVKNIVSIERGKTIQEQGLWLVNSNGQRTHLSNYINLY